MKAFGCWELSPARVTPQPHGGVPALLCPWGVPGFSLPELLARHLWAEDAERHPKPPPWTALPLL